MKRGYGAIWGVAGQKRLEPEEPRRDRDDEESNEEKCTSTVTVSQSSSSASSSSHSKTRFSKESPPPMRASATKHSEVLFQVRDSIDYAIQELAFIKSLQFEFARRLDRISMYVEVPHMPQLKPQQPPPPEETELEEMKLGKSVVAPVTEHPKKLEEAQAIPSSPVLSERSLSPIAVAGTLKQ